jgi:signal transduction histidine kinase
MSTKTIRVLGILLPVLLWILLNALRVYLGPYVTPMVELSLELLLVAAGGALFAHWVASRFERHDREVDQRAQQLEALRMAAISLTSEVELRDVLQRVLELSRELSGARYAALGVVDSTDGRIEEFLTAGISEAERAAMGSPPEGLGLLGAIMTERRSMRVDNLAADPRSVGFPEHHPHMSTLLGVPIMSKGVIFGNLYLTDKLNPTGTTPLPFTDQDQRTLEMFAAHAAVAIENARLNRQNRQIAIMRERERFGMNLHDGIIQSIYALGLMLEDAQHRIVSEPETAQSRIAGALTGLNSVIADIRSYIMDLRPERFEGRSLQAGLQAIADQAAERGEIRLDLNVDTKAADRATPRQTAELLHVAQEAMANIQKHAGACKVALGVRRQGDFILLEIADDGCGFDVFRTAGRANGQGLRNMQDRARALHGELEIDSVAGEGTRIVLSVPVARRVVGAG